GRLPIFAALHRDCHFLRFRSTTPMSMMGTGVSSSSMRLPTGSKLKNDRMSVFVIASFNSASAMVRPKILTFRQGLPTIDDDRGAGYIGCIIRSQEQDCVRHVPRRSKPAERHCLFHGPEEFGAALLPDAFRQNIARLDPVHRDPIGGKLDGCSLDEAVDSRLRCRIMAMSRRCYTRAGDGGCEDHSPAAFRSHDGQRGTR